MRRAYAPDNSLILCNKRSINIYSIPAKLSDPSKQLLSSFGGPELKFSKIELFRIVPLEPYSLWCMRETTRVGPISPNIGKASLPTCYKVFLVFPLQTDNFYVIQLTVVDGWKPVQNRMSHQNRILCTLQSSDVLFRSTSRSSTIGQIVKPRYGRILEFHKYDEFRLVENGLGELVTHRSPIVIKHRV